MDFLIESAGAFILLLDLLMVRWWESIIDSSLPLRHPACAVDAYNVGNTMMYTHKHYTTYDTRTIAAEYSDELWVPYKSPHAPDICIISSFEPRPPNGNVAAECVRLQLKNGPVCLWMWIVIRCLAGIRSLAVLNALRIRIRTYAFWLLISFSFSLCRSRGQRMLSNNQQWALRTNTTFAFWVRFLASVV